MRHQRAPDRAHLLLAAGERAGLLVAAVLEARKKLVHVRELHVEAPAGLGTVGAHAQVFLDAETRKQPAVLRHVGNAAFHDAMRRQAGEQVIIEAQLAPADRDHPGYRAHQRRLAGAVAADHADRLAVPHLERHIEQRPERAIACGHRAQLQHGRLSCRALPRYTSVTRASRAASPADPSKIFSP